MILKIIGFIKIFKAAFLDSFIMILIKSIIICISGAINSKIRLLMLFFMLRFNFRIRIIIYILR
jgi:hypothetical protein